MADLLFPRFDGQKIFGVSDHFTFRILRGDSLSIDLFLGLTGGTTKYGADPSGGLAFGVTGKFLGATTVAVQVLQAQLLSYAGIVATLGVPWPERFPANFRFWPNCYFVASEYVPDVAGIVASPGNQYALSYKLVIRHIPAL